MNNLSCKHCGGNVEVEDTRCPHCGIPLPPHHGSQRQRTFIIWFVLLIIFSIAMMIILPPDWSAFMEP